MSEEKKEEFEEIIGMRTIIRVFMFIFAAVGMFILLTASDFLSFFMGVVCIMLTLMLLVVLHSNPKKKGTDKELSKDDNESEQKSKTE